MLSKAIELLELELWKLNGLVKELHERKLHDRESYRRGEVKRFERILDLLVKEKSNESSR